MQKFAILLIVASAVALGQAQRFYSKCELARKLYQHGVPNLSAWVCLADVHTNGRFDVLHKEGDGYGLWELSSKTWCRDGKFLSTQTSRCNLDCDGFWDKELTNDVRCFMQAFTEKGFPEFRGWKIRHATCPDLKTYLSACGL